MSLVYDCLSTGLLPNEEQNFQSAGVLLGLTPTLLMTLAPTLGEIALLSTRRQLLALILALASPAINVPRTLFYTDPFHSLKDAPTAIPDSLLLADGWKAASASLIQFTLACAALANIVQVSNKRA